MLKGGDGWTDGRKDGRTDGRTSGNSPCVLQDIGPLGPLPKNTPPMVLLVDWVFYLFMKNAHLAVKEQQKKNFFINSFEHLV